MKILNLLLLVLVVFSVQAAAQYDPVDVWGELSHNDQRARVDDVMHTLELSGPGTRGYFIVHVPKGEKEAKTRARLRRIVGDFLWRDKAFDTKILLFELSLEAWKTFSVSFSAIPPSADVRRCEPPCTLITGAELIKHY